MALPEAVTAERDLSISEYWLRRVRQHTGDSYAGVPISKFPEDLRVYEHLLWESRADTVIEIGAQFGGSALWFRDRLRSYSTYRKSPEPLVVSIDIDIEAARSNIAAADPAHEQTIKLIEADICSPDLPDRVAQLLPTGARCLVVEDSAHIYETTAAALKGFARFVPPGGFFVVEDGCVDVEWMRLDGQWPRGVLPALHDWLATEEGGQFTLRRDLELYGISCHPEGFLQRIDPLELQS